MTLAMLHFYGFALFAAVKFDEFYFIVASRSISLFILNLRR
ncbi:hypothetical protein CAMRE0001_1113 [Campylobacter rectus RM3267]|uniref:Uncharacterized protein n=1 Tax=Campylobacter rectus RM3267 TaxID=553218 RepID=B9D5K2_CAMRE|nr:hypothetical protein CAMRE0001_1113 [Campylobacter rectus RM3267]